jgi:MFS family permease
MPVAMCIIASDILADLCGLSLGLVIALVPIGLLLWLAGWWSHRFWIVLTTTVLAGMVGLMEATNWGAQPIIVAVLLAIAAGVLALAMVRVFTFVAGGLAGVYLVQFAFPSLNQQMICFLVSGLLCLLLFRWFFMALTSFLGTTVIAYGTLALLNYWEVLDSVAWTDEYSLLLTIGCVGATVVGFVVQLLMYRWRERRRRKEEEEENENDMVGAILARIGFGNKKTKEAA